MSDNEVPTVTRDDLPTGALIVDVREDDEWRSGHIEGSVHVPLGSLANRMAYEPGELATDETLVVTCKGGGRASRAVAWLNANGFDAVSLDGGLLGWEASGRPLVSDTDTAPHVL